MNEKMNYQLNNGVEISNIGFGTWQTPDGDVAADAVKHAIKCGYRHIDTAQAYGNEASVGRAVRESGVPREELFITTKLTNNNHTYDLTMSSGENVVKALDGIDLKIYSGELLVILGSSGSGKSTLLNMLGGMDVPSSGNVLFHGADITGYNRRSTLNIEKEWIL